MKKFPNKRVVITGAGSGLGRALSLEFARLGWKIGIVDINDAGSEQTLQMVEQAGGKGEVFHADVTDPSAVKAMADHFFSTWRGVDILVNNAGIAICGAVGDVPLEQWKTIVDINFWGMLYGCHEFIPRDEGTRRGAHHECCVCRRVTEPYQYVSIQRDQGRCYLSFGNVKDGGGTL